MQVKYSVDFQLLEVANRKMFPTKVSSIEMSPIIWAPIKAHNIALQDMWCLKFCNPKTITKWYKGHINTRLSVSLMWTPVLGPILECLHREH